MRREAEVTPTELRAGESQNANGDDVGASVERKARWWLWGGLAVVLIAGTIIAVTVSADDSQEVSADDSLRTADVVRTDLADETIYNATLGRPVGADLPAGVEGTVTSLPEAGTVVESGEALFVIDDSPVRLVQGDLPAYRDLHLGDTVSTIPAASTGVVTWLPEAGTIIQSGDAIVRIDEQPVVLLQGDLPMYRRLERDVEGQDVLQLESALVSLGYDSEGDVTVDQEFTAATETMVERWQEDLGVDETGEVEVGQIVFAPLPGQILSIESAVGASVNAGTTLMTVSAGAPMEGEDVLQLEEAMSALGYTVGAVDGIYDTDLAAAVVSWTTDAGHGSAGYLPLGSIIFNDGPLRTASVSAEVGTAVTPSSPVVNAADLETIVRLDLPASDQDLLAVGSNGVIALPDRSETTGTVTFVSSVAENEEPGSPATFAIEISLNDPSVAEGLDEAPVDVRVVSDAVEDVVAVPVSALLALAEGGYAVEIVEGETSRLVAVEPGFFADGMVEISGSVEVGDTVIVP